MKSFHVIIFHVSYLFLFFQFSHSDLVFLLSAWALNCNIKNLIPLSCAYEAYYWHECPFFCVRSLSFCLWCGITIILIVVNIILIQPNMCSHNDWNGIDIILCFFLFSIFIQNSIASIATIVNLALYIFITLCYNARVFTEFLRANEILFFYVAFFLPSG